MATPKRQKTLFAYFSKGEAKRGDKTVCNGTVHKPTVITPDRPTMSKLQSHAYDGVKEEDSFSFNASSGCDDVVMRSSNDENGFGHADAKLDVVAPSVNCISSTSTPKPCKRRLDQYCSSPRAVAKVETSLDDANDSGTSTDAGQQSFSSTLPLDDSFGDASFTSVVDKEHFKHFEFSFLKPENIRDANMRRPDHPLYDSRTLYVPKDFLMKQTPGLRQWWEMKSAHADTILFFKVGKFYECYHMDAVIAVKNLNLTFMKGDYAHCGFPEIAFARFCDQLVVRGYKVARVEQTETPEMMEARLRTGRDKSQGRVVKREICRIVTRGTKMYSVVDGEDSTVNASYLCAICEKEAGADIRFGICFVDTAVGKIYLSEFDDDHQCSRLRTVLAHYPPVQILVPRTSLSARLKALLRQTFCSTSKEALFLKSQFWSAEDTIQNLVSSGYFPSTNGAVAGSPTEALPPVLVSMLDAREVLGVKPRSDRMLTVSALGAVVWFLRQCLIDVDVLSRRMFEEYVPLDCAVRAETPTGCCIVNNMILDDTTLYNLNVVSCPNEDGLFSSSLFEQVDFCHAAFGKRLLRQWLCSPSCIPKVIEERQRAVEDLIQLPEVTAFLTNSMKAMPDLERLLQKFHSLGLKYRSVDHPDGRAVLFEAAVYNRRKINDFMQMIDSFSKLLSVVAFVADRRITFKSRLLRNSLTSCARDPAGRFPDIEEDLRYFNTCFDHEKARSEGVVIPNKGVHQEYDCAETQLTDAELALENYIKKIRKRFGCSAIAYVKGGRNRYQLEIPETSCQQVGFEFDLKSQRKGFKRYSTAELDQLLKELSSAESRRSEALKDIMRHLFSTFSARGDKWRAAVECASLWDVLFSLTKYSTSSSCAMCFPTVVPSDSRTPVISIVEGVHPCFVNIRTLASQFIPNDTHIGRVEDDQASPMVLLLTGANMGGKTTLMRQVGLIVILAQVGCKVPAASCLLTPVDRIFTRIGASDSILRGQSTFFVELSETNGILKNATAHSLVIIDELGRGTSTHDGTAIAFAVLKELANNITCRTIFSTHYHSVVEDFSDHPNVFVGHMACAVENEAEADDPVSENVTFLYKLERGACPKSYGFNAAKLAGIRPEVLRNAYAKSKQFANYHQFMLSLRQLAKVQKRLTDEQLIDRLTEMFHLKV